MLSINIHQTYVVAINTMVNKTGASKNNAMSFKCTANILSNLYIIGNN